MRQHEKTCELGVRPHNIYNYARQGTFDKVPITVRWLLSAPYYPDLPFWQIRAASGVREAFPYVLVALVKCPAVDGRVRLVCRCWENEFR